MIECIKDSLDVDSKLRNIIEFKKKSKLMWTVIV